MNAKELVKNTFRNRKVSRPPFIPFIGSYLTKVDQLSMEEILTDTGLLYQALRNTQQLLNYDAAVLPLDTTLEAEAFGIQIQWDNGMKPVLQNRISQEEGPHFNAETWVNQGRIPVFLEAVKRFVQVHGKQLPAFATVSGPLTTWYQLFGNELQSGIRENVEPAYLPHIEIIVQALIALCKSYAEAGVDGIIINEEEIPVSIKDLSLFSGIYKPIFNVIRFYNKVSILRVPKHEEMFHPILSSLGMDAWIGSADNSSAMGEGDTRGVRGVSLSQQFWSSDMKPDELVFQQPIKGIFLTTGEPLDQEKVELLDLQEKIENISGENYWR